MQRTRITNESHFRSLPERRWERIERGDAQIGFNLTRGVGIQRGRDHMRQTSNAIRQQLRLVTEQRS
jgi:hypothetical protein